VWLVARVRECVPITLHFGSGTSNLGARADMYSRGGFAAFAGRANEPGTCYPSIEARKGNARQVATPWTKTLA